MADDRAKSAPTRGTVCTACPMLCDDIVVTGLGRADGIEVGLACEFGRRSIVSAAVSRGSAGRPAAVVDGVASSLEAAVARAAGMLRSARRVLVTGLASVPIEAQRTAGAIAERCGAAFDTGAADGAVVAGPTIARVGEVTAAWEELRDRADCVLLWFVDPTRSHPRFAERFLAAGADRPPRTVIAVGPTAPVLPTGVACRHVAAPDEAAVGLARELTAAIDRSAGGTTLEPLAAIVEAILRAGCVAVVTGNTDAVGLSRWAVSRLVRRLCHGKPAFEVRLGAGIAAGGGNVAGAAAVSTWRYGASSAIARAMDRGGTFEPAEADGRRLLDRGEVDAVLVVGDPSSAMRESLVAAANARRVSIVWLGADAGEVVSGGTSSVFLRTPSPLLETAGTMLREDGTLVEIRETCAADVPSMLETLSTILGELGS